MLYVETILRNPITASDTEINPPMYQCTWRCAYTVASPITASDTEITLPMHQCTWRCATTMACLFSCQPGASLLKSPLSFLDCFLTIKMTSGPKWPKPIVGSRKFPGSKGTPCGTDHITHQVQTDLYWPCHSVPTGAYRFQASTIYPKHGKDMTYIFNLSALYFLLICFQRLSQNHCYSFTMKQIYLINIKFTHLYFVCLLINHRMYFLTNLVKMKHNLFAVTSVM